MFTRESVLASDWYAARLDAKQAAASGRADAGLAAIEKFVSTPGNEEPTARLDMPARVAAAQAEAAAPVRPAVPRAAGRHRRAARRSDPGPEQQEIRPSPDVLWAGPITAEATCR